MIVPKAPANLAALALACAPLLFSAADLRAQSGEQTKRMRELERRLERAEAELARRRGPTDPTPPVIEAPHWWQNCAEGSSGAEHWPQACTAAVYAARLDRAADDHDGREGGAGDEKSKEGLHGDFAYGQIKSKARADRG